MTPFIYGAQLAPSQHRISKEIYSLLPTQLSSTTYFLELGQEKV